MFQNVNGGSIAPSCGPLWVPEPGLKTPSEDYLQYIN